MIFHAYHGLSEFERQQGQRFSVDVELTMDLKKAGQSDLLEHTIDVREVHEVANEIVIEGEFLLVEAMAERIAQALLDRFNVKEVLVRVGKPNAPLEGLSDGFEVEITRGN